ncbi:MAG: hypothetical protein KF782_14460 [Labilithrix sp.]|nr:hypothetical protein [Labilithrix sp.]
MQVSAGRGVPSPGACACPQGSTEETRMMFVGIIGFVVVTLLVTALVLKGNGDSINNYL